MRKLVYGALALSAALAVGFGVNAADASAATSYKFTITPRADGTGDMLTIEASGATNLFVAPTSLAKQTGKDSSGNAYADTAYVKAAGLNAWDKYENNGTSGMFDIDLSKFSAKQDKFFLVKVDWETDADAVLVEVPAGKTLKSATWKKDGGISIKKGDGKIYGSAAGEENPGSEYAFSGSLAFKGSNPHVDGTSSEGSLFELDPSTYGIYTQNGATLSMYGKANATPVSAPISNNDGTEELYKTSSVTYKKILDKKNGNPITFYKTNQRTGAPVKLTIPKRPSAGAITVDYVNGKVTIPKGTKVEFTASGGAIDVYKTAGGGTSGINAQASATDYSDSASNGKLKAQTTFWLGSVNKLLDSSAVATNYV
ncbi:MAG: hypothetical protein IJ733_14245 [Lachnospiraceae bacterium]|nr:hypothetical protein [Lachnospiraceae bacterium]